MLAVAAPALPAGLGAAGLVVTALGWAVLGVVLWAYRRSLFAIAIWLADKMDAVAINVRVATIKPLAPISGAVRHAAKAVESALAEAALGCEHATVWLAQQVWSMIVWQAREVADLAVTVEHALGLQKIVDVPKVVRTAIAPTLTRLHGIDRLLGRIEAQAKAQWKRLSRGIDRVNTLTTKTIPKALGKVTGRVGTLERTIASPRWWAKNWSRVLTPAVAATMVATALGRLGLRFLRCGNFRRAGKAVCGMDANLLESLLGASLLVVGGLSLREMARDLQEPTALVAKGLDKLITELK